MAVTAGADWAAWVRNLEPHPSQSGKYGLIWQRDFTYQFFNLGDLGRPQTDCVYETELTWNGSSLAVGRFGPSSPRSRPSASRPGA